MFQAVSLARLYELETLGTVPCSLKQLGLLAWERKSQLVAVIGGLQTSEAII